MVDWKNIGYNKNLTEDIILEFYDKLHWGILLNGQKINKKTFEKLGKGKRLYLLMNWREIYNQIK